MSLDTDCEELFNADVLRVRRLARLPDTTMSFIYHETLLSHTDDSDNSVLFMNTMKKHWRQDALSVPAEWIHHDWSKPLPSVRLSFLNIQLQPIRDCLSLISAGPQPEDITTNCSPRYHDETTELTASRVFRVLDYVELTKGVPDPMLVHRLAGMFTGIHSCWVKENPVFRFPPALSATTEDPVGISWVSALLPIRPTRPTAHKRARAAPLTIMNPALLLGIIDESSSLEHGHNDRLTRLGQAVQPNLDALLMNLALRQQQGLSPPLNELPDWTMLFGVCYSMDVVTIVAYVPRFHSDEDVVRYHSFVVDELPYKARTPGEDSREAILDRLRVAIALQTLRRHVERLAGLWEDVVWPTSIIDMETADVREVTGIISPSPSIVTDSRSLHKWSLDWIPAGGSGDEDDEEYQEMEAEDYRQSVEKVDAWLTGDGSKDSTQIFV